MSYQPPFTVGKKLSELNISRTGYSKLYIYFVTEISAFLIKFYWTRPWPAFGRQGLVGSSGGYTYHGVQFSRLASRLRRSARSKSVEKWKKRNFSYSRTIEKCLEMGETQFLLFIGTFKKCLEMGENGFSFSPISRHFLSFLLFLDTFSLISRSKRSLEMGENGFPFSPISRHLALAGLRSKTV